jgi:hypothetical protein
MRRAVDGRSVLLCRGAPAIALPSVAKSARQIGMLAPGSLAIVASLAGLVTAVLPHLCFPVVVF